MKIRTTSNLEHVVRDYNYHDRKHSGRWARNARSRSNRRRTRRRSRGGR